MSKYQNYIAVPEAVWFKSLPDTWKAVKMRALFSERVTKVSDKDYPPLSVGYIGVVPQLANAAKTDNGDNRKLIKAGDFAINSRSDRKGAGGISKYDGSCSMIITVLKPHSEINGTFYHYLLRSHYFSEEFYRNGNGIVGDLWTTKWKTMRNIYVTVPPREEQDQIVSFLDWKVTEINKLISVKKKQVLSYKELRKATIDQGILYGFKKSESKSSGVYWLGDIPASWEVLPLKRICRVNASIADIVKSKDNGDLVTFLPMEKVTETGKIDCSLKKKISEVRTGFSSFAKGDVVVAKITPCFENGKGACLGNLDTDIGFGTTEFINLRPSDKVLSKYLYMITMTRPFRQIGQEFMTGSAGQKRVSVNFIKNFTLGIPDITEQENILTEIEKKLAQIDKAIKYESDDIKLLKELKDRIISDTVTGEIDVRSVEIPKYEFVEEQFDVADEESDETEAAG